MIDLVAGISWEPEIRGVLVAATGVTVLMGSVWLLLATNMGHRLASLVSAAGLMSWMFIMALIWALYGIGLRGDPPTWELVDIKEGAVSSFSASGDEADVRLLADIESGITAQEIINKYCPGLVSATETARFERARTGDPLIELDYDATGRDYCTEEVGELVTVDPLIIDLDARNVNDAVVATSPLGDQDPRYLSDADLQLGIDEAIADQTRKVSQLSLSSLAAARGLVAEAKAGGDIIVGGDWELLSSGAAGEAFASADAFLVERGGSEPGGFDASTDFFITNAFKSGGKPGNDPEDGQMSRAWTEIRNTVMFWQPDLYTIVQVLPTLDKPTVEGQPPPFSEIDPDGELVTVIMKRDAGGIFPGLSGVRTPAVLIGLASFAIFLMLCWMLHERDKTWERHQAEWDPAQASS